jgi:hypothetical protein
MIEPAAFVNFVSDRTLEDLASEFSDRLFAGIPFVGRDEGIWDEVPAVRLRDRFLGLEIVLGGTVGKDGGFSVEAMVADWEPHIAVTGRADFSEFVAYLLGGIRDVRIIEEKDAEM